MRTEVGRPVRSFDDEGAGRPENRLAYSTVMTVLQRLAVKDLVIQVRNAHAFQQAPNHRREELVVDLMIDALRDIPNRSGRQAAFGSSSDQ